MHLVGALTILQSACASVEQAHPGGINTESGMVPTATNGVTSAKPSILQRPDLSPIIGDACKVARQYGYDFIGMESCSMWHAFIRALGPIFTTASKEMARENGRQILHVDVHRFDWAPSTKLTKDWLSTRPRA